jgi:hypothetical protein
MKKSIIYAIVTSARTAERKDQCYEILHLQERILQMQDQILSMQGTSNFLNLYFLKVIFKLSRIVPTKNP